MGSVLVLADSLAAQDDYTLEMTTTRKSTNPSGRSVTPEYFQCLTGNQQLKKTSKTTIKNNSNNNNNNNNNNNTMSCHHHHHHESKRVNNRLPQNQQLIMVISSCLRLPTLDVKTMCCVLKPLEDEDAEVRHLPAFPSL